VFFSKNCDVPIFLLSDLDQRLDFLGHAGAHIVHELLNGVAVAQAGVHSGLKVLDRDHPIRIAVTVVKDLLAALGKGLFPGVNVRPTGLVALVNGEEAVTVHIETGLEHLDGALSVVFTGFQRGLVLLTLCSGHSSPIGTERRKDLVWVSRGTVVRVV